MKPFRIVGLSFVLAGSCIASPDPVDPARELEIVDDLVVRNARAKNATSGPWSFRGLAVRLAGSDDEAVEAVHDTLARLGLSADVLCPWLRDDVGNGCDERCTSCSARRLDLARAPFRLAAISNRLDLADDPDTRHGETRFVFAVTQGPGDDRSSRALPATVVFEYRVPESRPLSEWARVWHALGRLDGDDYLTALATLTRDLTASLAQVRTHVMSRMNELAFDGDGRFRPRTFDGAKCTTCHGGENTVIDGAFHVSPLRDGAERLSPFVFSDLPRREQSLRQRL